MATPDQIRRRGRWSLILGTLIAALMLSAVAFASVSTDQADYAPGDVVTISGDNSDGAGYLAGETVSVAVSGPNGYEASCEGLADENGAWSCQVTLWDSLDAVGDYTYTATGQQSGVSESGTFTDAININSFQSNCDTADDSFTTGETVCAKATGLPGGGGGTSGKIEWWAPGAGSATRTTTFSGASGNFTDTFAPTVCGTWTLKVYAPSATFQDDDTFEVTGCAPSNTAPIVAFNNPPTLANEGDTKTFNFDITDTSTDTHSFATGFPDCGSEGTLVASSESINNATHTGTFQCVFPDGLNPAVASTVRVQVEDQGNLDSNIATTDVTVNNVAPTIAISGASNVDEGSPYSLTLGVVTDPGTDTVTSYVVHWDDGSSNADSSNGVKTHTYADGPNVYAITVDLVDEDGTFLDRANALSVTVDNVAPTIAISGASNVDEGSPYSLTLGAVTDPGTDTVTAYIVHWGDGFSDSYGTNGVKTHTYADGPNSYAITVDLTDEDGTFLDQANALSVTVDNVAPTINSLVAGAAVSCNTANSLTINFSDPAGSNDTNSALIDWGDSSSDNPMNISSGDVAVHTYASAGPHTATVTVSDEDGGTSASMQQTLVVNYNTSGVLQPVNWTQAQNNPSIFKWGSTIPVRVRFTDCDGTPAGGLSVKIAVKKIAGSTPPSGDDETITNTNSPDSGGYMRWVDSQYIYNLNTKSLADKTATYHITITVESTMQTVETDFGTRER